MNDNAPAGWYPQPDGSQRWWTGSTWSADAGPEPSLEVIVPGQVVRPAAARLPVPQQAPAAAPWPAPGHYGQAVQVAPKNPGISVIASFFLPGLGQFVNGQAGKGVAFLVCYFMSFLLMFILIGFVTVFVVWVWSMADAYSGAQAWNRRHGIIS